MPFHNRREAGTQLAHRLESMRPRRPAVLALPRGGVPVGFEIATTLDAPLDVLVIRKIGAPENPEFGIGAAAEDGSHWINQDIADALGLNDIEVDEAITRQVKEAKERAWRYRGNRPMLDITGRTVILVDDGLATGGTAIAAARVLRRRGAQQVVFAAPVGAPRSLLRLERFVDRVVCIDTPEDFSAVGLWYDDFSQISDEEVIRLLAEAAQIHQHRTRTTYGRTGTD